ncbi:MAG: DUF547 domain-containing protein [Elainellaceae cyanobacterium]
MTAFKIWDSLLRHYVDDRGRVDYQSWKAKSEDTLHAWLSEIRDLDHPHSHDANTQLAFWINLYNALCIQQVLKHYPITSIRPKILGIPNWIGFLWFFLHPIYQLGDRRYSLNRIEHRVLRRQFQDPRIHFALVCAAVGCPLLRNEAYLPETVQTQLEEDAQRFIQNPDKVRYEARDRTLYCSKIFKWYHRDFLQVAPSIPDYIQNYLTAPMPMGDEVNVRYLPYDLSLNQRTSS